MKHRDSSSVKIIVICRGMVEDVAEDSELAVGVADSVVAVELSVVVDDVAVEPPVLVDDVAVELPVLVDDVTVEISVVVDIDAVEVAVVVDDVVAIEVAETDGLGCTQ